MSETRTSGLWNFVAGAAGLAVLIGVAAGCGPDVPAAAVEIRAESDCAVAPETGMGFVLDSGLVLTAAHVVAGATSVELRTDRGPVTGSIVAFDPDNDLAFVRPDRPLPHGWTLADTTALNDVERGTGGFVYVTRDDAVTRLGAEIVRPVQIETEDIYIDADVSRPGWALGYPIEPGDSGAAVIVDGQIIGVVWARSRSVENRAYAIDPVRGGELLTRQLNAGRLDVEPGIDITRCTP